jgi:type II secretory pathway pseudopilin PulG
MNYSPYNNGYTIVELIVVMNITMTVIALGLMLYSAYTTYTRNVLFTIEKQQRMVRSLEYIHSVVDKSERFSIRNNGLGIEIASEGKHIAIIHNAITINGIAWIDDIAVHSADVADRDGTIFNIGDAYGDMPGMQKHEFASPDIKYLRMELSVGGKPYKYEYRPRQVSDRMFRNITR